MTGQRRCRNCGELELADNAAAKVGCSNFELERRSVQRRGIFSEHARQIAEPGAQDRRDPVAQLRHDTLEAVTMLQRSVDDLANALRALNDRVNGMGDAVDRVSSRIDNLPNGLGL